MTKIIQISLFIILGIPGALIFVFSSIMLIGKVIDPKATLPNSSILILTCIIGIAATLIGIGKLKLWLYSLVFIAFPISFWLWAVINPNMTGGIITMFGFVAVSVFGTLKAVQHYYGERQNEN